MLGSIAWLAVLVLLALFELIGRLARRPIGPSALVQYLSASMPGRIAMVTIWAGFGWHLFTRYTPVR